MTTGGAHADEWLQYKFAPTRNGYSEAGMPETLQIAWSFRKDGWFSSPVVEKLLVFVGSEDGKLRALYAYNGKTAWELEVGAEVYSPALFAGRLYFGAADGMIYCVDAETGENVWRYRTGDAVRASPLVVDNRVIIPSTDNWLYVLDASTGGLLWKLDLGSMSTSSPALYENTLFVPTWAGKVYAYDRSQFGLRWVKQLGEPGMLENYAIVTTPAVGDGILYVGSNDRRVYALTVDGEVVWSFSANEKPSDPVTDNQRVYFGTRSGTFYALNAETGELVWSVDCDGPILSSPTVTDQHVVFGTSKGKLYVVDKQNGQVIGSTKLDSIISEPVLAYNKIFVAGDGVLYCLGSWGKTGETGAEQGWIYLGIAALLFLILLGLSRVKPER